jgi:hypothetical protein
VPAGATADVAISSFSLSPVDADVFRTCGKGIAAIWMARWLSGAFDVPPWKGDIP